MVSISFIFLCFVNRKFSILESVLVCRGLRPNSRLEMVDEHYNKPCKTCKRLTHHYNRLGGLLGRLNELLENSATICSVHLEHVGGYLQKTLQCLSQQIIVQLTKQVMHITCMIWEVILETFIYSSCDKPLPFVNLMTTQSHLNLHQGFNELLPLII